MSRECCCDCWCWADSGVTLEWRASGSGFKGLQGSIRVEGTSCGAELHAAAV